MKLGGFENPNTGAESFQHNDDNNFEINKAVVFSWLKEAVKKDPDILIAVNVVMTDGIREALKKEAEYAATVEFGFHAMFLKHYRGKWDLIRSKINEMMRLGRLRIPKESWEKVLKDIENK